MKYVKIRSEKEPTTAVMKMKRRVQTYFLPLKVTKGTQNNLIWCILIFIWCIKKESNFMHTIQCFRKDKVNGIILICLEQPRWENWMHFIVTVRVKLRGFGEVTSICFYSVALHPIPWQMEKISGYVSIQLIPQVPRLRILTNWLINFSLASCQYKKQIFVLFANFSLELWQIDWNSFSV